MTEFYNQKIECMPQAEIKQLQLKLFNRQLKRANKAKAYQNKLPQSITDLSEIKNISFTTKDDLRKSGKFGYLAIPEEEIARFNSTSGTTGEPVMVYFSKSDIENIAQRSARNHFMAGIRKGDILQIISSSNLFIGGWCFSGGSFELGASVLQTGPGNTKRQIKFLKEMKSKFIFSTSGYFLHLLNSLSNDDMKEIALKGAIIGAEPTSMEAKKIVAEKYHLDLYDIYGFTEVGGPFAQDCHFHKGLHVPEDSFYIEIIDPESGEVLPDGEYGELVVTPLQQEAMPLIRYRTRDITRIIPHECGCGRTHRLIEPVSHRIDDMMIINGVNIFPSQIEECIYKHLSDTTNYLIRIKESEGLKKMIIDIETPKDILADIDKLHILEDKLIKELKSEIIISPQLNFIKIGTLPEFQGKAKRVLAE